MKELRVTKLVIGILMIILAVWLFVQSLLGGLIGIMGPRNIFAGVIEMVVSLLFLAAGIVYVATEKRKSLGGDITGFILMLIAGLLGVIGWTNYGLVFYGVAALIIGIGFFVWHLCIY